MEARSVEEAGVIDEARLEKSIEEVIAEHGGDSREAIKALLERLAYLEAARDKALDLVSFGYARGKVERA